MLEPFRSDFNQSFTLGKYAELLRLLNQRTRTQIEFRIAETPCFFPKPLIDTMITAGIELTEQLIHNSAYLQAAAAATPAKYLVPNQDAHPHFMTVDFGLVRNVAGELEPKLVELQAFPSLYGYQPLLAQTYAEVFAIEPTLHYRFAGLDETSYWSLLRQVIIGTHAPENVVLLELDPTHQKTLPDFHVHEDHLGIRTVDARTLTREGNRLFYKSSENSGGRFIPIHRIYNRMIADEVERTGTQLPFDYRDELAVEWAGHPNWYFQLSKLSLPYLDHPTVPTAVFLDDWFAGSGRDRLPQDRSQWILKPLYSFAGKGIQFEPTDAELTAIPVSQRHAYLLQQRVHFEPVIQTPEGPTQAEIRILYLWPEGGSLTPMTSLVRMGRGLMMGVDHNREKTWVGGSAGFYATI